MKKKYKNINEEVNRIKGLFSEERLYGNLIVESPIPPIKNIITSMDDIIKILIKSNNLDNAGAVIIKKTLEDDLTKISNSIKTIDGVKKLLDPKEVNNITKQITDSYNNAFSEEIKAITIPYKGTIRKNIEQEIKDITKYYNEINLEIIKKLNEVISKKSKFPDELTKEINELYPGVGDKIKKLYNPLIYNIMDFIKKNFPILFKQIKTILSKIIKWITGINNLKNLLKGDWSVKGKESVKILVKWWVIKSQLERQLCNIIYRPKNKNPIKEQYTITSAELQDSIVILFWKAVQRFFNIKLNCLDIKAAHEEAKKYMQEISKQTEIPLDKITNMYDVETIKAKTALNNTQEQINNAVKPYTDKIQPYYDKMSPNEKEELNKVIDEMAKQLE